MPDIRSFEDLIAWQKARVLARAVYAATRSGGLARDFGLASQMQRSAVSVMANIAEGYERRGAADRHFLSVAKASCAELSSHMYVAVDAEYLDQATFDELNSRAREVGRIIAGLHKSLSTGRS